MSVDDWQDGLWWVPYVPKYMIVKFVRHTNTQLHTANEKEYAYDAAEFTRYKREAVTKQWVFVQAAVKAGLVKPCEI